jgi:lysophospholipase L1-like esterase
MISSRWRQAAANAALALGTTLVVGGGAEMLARFILRRIEPPQAEVRPTTKRPGHAGFYVMPSTSPGWPPWTEFNRDGLRDQPHPRPKPPGVYRIAILGDSVTVGPDGHPDQAYPQVLGRILAARGPRAEVMNVALWGWSTRDEATAWERLARPYRPDLVVLAVCLNDILDLQGEALPPSPLLLALHRHSALVRLAIGARRRELSRVEDLFLRPDAPDVRASLQRLSSAIVDLRRRVEADGSRFALILFPYREQVTPSAPHPSVQSHVSSFAAREGIPYLDLRPTLAPLGEAAFLPGDGIHMSPNGCEATARTLSEWEILPVAVRTPSLALDLVQSTWATPVWTETLVTRLTHEDARVRRAAALALARLRDPRANEALLRALADPEEGVRWEAARALASIGVNESDVPAIGAALASPDPFIRGFAAWIIGELGTRARVSLPALVTAQNDPDPGIRALVLRSLAAVGFGEPEAVEALRKALRGGTGDDRWRAARSLGRLGSPARVAIPDLIAALRADNGHVRRHTAVALGRLGEGEGVRPALEEATRDPDPAVAAAATEALTSIGARR